MGGGSIILRPYCEPSAVETNFPENYYINSFNKMCILSFNLVLRIICVNEYVLKVQNCVAWGKILPFN